MKNVFEGSGLKEKKNLNDFPFFFLFTNVHKEFSVRRFEVGH